MKKTLIETVAIPVALLIFSPIIVTLMGMREHDLPMTVGGIVAGMLLYAPLLHWIGLI
jgi:hypothetical protein